ncbi:MAG TPA: hypothetical protein VF884_11660, partial [Nitrososphaeraceae archaeon]
SGPCLIVNHYLLAINLLELTKDDSKDKRSSVNAEIEFIPIYSSAYYPLALPYVFPIAFLRIS